MGIAAAFLLLIVLVFAFSPRFIDSGSRQNESAAVGSLRRIHDLQSKYAATHPNEGFACQLQRLRQGDHATNDYDPATAPLSGQWSGYKFVLVECTPAKNGIVIRYQLAAFPITRGLTRVRAFCTDESGTLFYTQNSSATECLSSRKTW
jgi:hypothetical protein